MWRMPLGRPVVPLVYMIVARSSAATSPAGRGRRRAPAASPYARIAGARVRRRRRPAPTLRRRREPEARAPSSAGAGGGRHDHARRRVAQQRREPGGVQQRRQRDRGGAQLEARPVARDELDRVRQHRRDAVAAHTPRPASAFAQRLTYASSSRQSSRISRSPAGGSQPYARTGTSHGARATGRVPVRRSDPGVHAPPPSQPVARVAPRERAPPDRRPALQRDDLEQLAHLGGRQEHLHRRRRAKVVDATSGRRSRRAGRGCPQPIRNAACDAKPATPSPRARPLRRPP